jgi:hypothetical protein
MLPYPSLRKMLRKRWKAERKQLKKISSGAAVPNLKN